MKNRRKQSSKKVGPKQNDRKKVRQGLEDQGI